MADTTPQVLNKTLPPVTVFVPPSGNNVDVIYQDLQHLASLVSGLTAQVERIQKVVRIDKQEAETAERKGVGELMQAVAENTNITRAFISEMRKKEREEENDYAQRGRVARRRELEKRNAALRQVRLMKSCKQELTKRCPCGQHRGILFSTIDGIIIEENMCPKVWWISQSRLAFEEGTLRAFSESTPMSLYLSAYKLADN